MGHVHHHAQTENTRVVLRTGWLNVAKYCQNKKYIFSVYLIYFLAGGRRVFREFLRCEYSEENILFWLACEDLKKENNPEKVEEKARMIYEDYVSILSPREVSWDQSISSYLSAEMTRFCTKSSSTDETISLS